METGKKINLGKFKNLETSLTNCTMGYNFKEQGQLPIGCQFFLIGTTIQRRVTQWGFDDLFFGRFRRLF